MRKVLFGLVLIVLVVGFVFGVVYDINNSSEKRLLNDSICTDRYPLNRIDDCDECHDLS